VPQTSLAVELREDAAAVAEQEDADEFTADHAASSLAGFQLGTLRARDDDAGSDTPENATTAAGSGTDEDGLPGATANSAPAGETPPPAPQEPAPADHNHLPGTPKTQNTAPHTPVDEPPCHAHEEPDPAEPAPPGAPQDAAVAARSPRIDRS